MAHILIIDDDLLFCEALRFIMEEEGHHVSLAHTLTTARDLLKKNIFAVAVIDVCLPDGNGLDLLAGLALLPEPPEAIVVTAMGNPQGAEMAITAGAWDYVQKPADMGEISLMVQRALKNREQKRKKVHLARASGIVGESLPMRLTLLRLFEAAQSDTPVLIVGETGTGKELVARAIHNNSRRAGGPFVVVDCGAIAPTLLESELFGNVRGAFTGAAQSRPGLVRLADQGTLFLDEVGELSPEHQKVFLRVLQERTFRPIGGAEEIRSDFRVVAATNRDLSEMAAGGRFRQDLLFRLQGSSIAMPALRMRGQDILLLARHALERSLSQYGMKDKDFSAEALEAFSLYEWPGNVRELLYTIERAVLAAHDDPLILPQHLPLHLRAHAARLRLEERVPSAPAGQGTGGRDTAARADMVEEHDPAGAFRARERDGRGGFPGAPGMELEQSGADASPLARDGGKLYPPPAKAEERDRAAALPPQSWREFQETHLHEHKRRYLLSLLQWADGNIPRAAERAGLSRQRLYSLLRDHGITRQWEE